MKLFNNKISQDLFLFDSKIKKQDKILAGIDEAGRGPLAGPVVACCLSLKENSIIPGLNDSKKLSENQRETLYPIIKENTLSIGIGIVSHDIIDKINILKATFLAMTIAFNEYKIKMIAQNIQVIIDGNMRVPSINESQEPIIKGDSLSASIAAASVIAKVTRDKIMKEMHEKYPVYNFLKHKGYPTKEHIEAIKKHGIVEIHRKTFYPVSDYC